MALETARIDKNWLAHLFSSADRGDSIDPLYSRLGWKAARMKVRNSLRSLRRRHRGNRVVRRRGRIYVINKTNRRFKARQG